MKKRGFWVCFLFFFNLLYFNRKENRAVEFSTLVCDCPVYVNQKIGMVSGRILDFKLQNITLNGLSRKEFVERMLFGALGAHVINGKLENPA